jgi:uncharacterized metal-binding protein
MQKNVNVIVGLCMGHEMLFTMTTLIVKDRLLGQNPVIAPLQQLHKDLVKSQKRI